MRASPLRRAGANLLAVVAVFSILACASAPTPDTAADTLKTLDDAYRAAVAVHDARQATDAPEVHAAHRKTLNAMRDGLQGSWRAVEALKLSGVGAMPAGVLSDAARSARNFLALAVDLGALDQKKADAVLAFLEAAFPGGVS